MKFRLHINTIGGLQLFQVIRFSAFLLIGILLAKAGVSITVIGNYEKLMLLAGVSSFFWVQGILNNLLAIYPTHAVKKSFLFNAFVALSLISILIFLLLSALKDSLSATLSITNEKAFHFITLYIAINSPCYLIEYIYLLRKESATLVLYGVVSSLLSVISIVIPLVAGYTLEISLMWLVLVAVLRFLWLTRLMVRHSDPDFEKNLLVENLKFSTPLILSYLIGGSADYIDGLMVSHFFSADEFAVFRYGAKEFPLSLLLANALSTSMIPILSGGNSVKDNLGILKTKSLRLMHILFPASMLMLLCSKWIYPVVFDIRFAASADLFNIYILLAVCRTLMPHPVAFALKHNKAILFISIAEVIINIVSSYLLMLRFGIAGIAFGTVIAFCFEKIMVGLLLVRKNHIYPGTYIPLKQWGIYSTMLIAIYIFCAL